MNVYVYLQVWQNLNLCKKSNICTHVNIYAIEVFIIFIDGFDRSNCIATSCVKAQNIFDYFNVII